MHTQKTARNAAVDKTIYVTYTHEKTRIKHFLYLSHAIICGMKSNDVQKMCRHTTHTPRTTHINILSHLVHSYKVQTGNIFGNFIFLDFKECHFLICFLWFMFINISRCWCVWWACSNHMPKKKNLHNKRG